MIKEQQIHAVDEGIVAGKLRDALAAHLYQEAGRLGLSLSASRIASLRDALLRKTDAAPEAERDHKGRLLREDVPFDIYNREKLEVHDYLHMVSQEMRKRLGQYVTPTVIVRYILDAVGYREDEDILDKRLADPACGSGIFLVEAIRTYLAALHRSGMPMEKWYPCARSAFVGVDLDPIACLYTQFNVSLLLTPAILFWADAHPDALLPPLMIYCFDTLRMVATELTGPRLFSYTASTLQLTNSFDFVVGNPPYHKISQLDKELQEVFRASLYGHPNAYGLFLHSGIEMLQPGGVLGYIVPRSMLSGLYFKNLRKFIELQSDLKEITLITERKKVFDNVLQGTMILVVQRRYCENKREPAPINALKTAVARSALELETRNMPAACVDQKKVMRHLNGSIVWFVSDIHQTYDIMDKILDRHPLLSSPAVGCPAKTGPIVWNRVKPLLRAYPEADALPLVWATDVGRFSFTFASAGEGRQPYLKVTPRTHQLVNQGLSLMAQRVTADEQPHRLVASVPEHFCAEHKGGYFVENHLNIIQPGPGAPSIDLYYLLSILCSDVMEFFFRTMNGNTQVSATELNLMPVPRCNQEMQIASIARELQQMSEEISRVSLEQRLNEWVAEAYGITPRELDFVRNSLMKNQVTHEERNGR